MDLICFAFLAMIDKKYICSAQTNTEWQSNTQAAWCRFHPLHLHLIRLPFHGSKLCSHNLTV